MSVPTRLLSTLLATLCCLSATAPVPARADAADDARPSPGTGARPVALPDSQAFDLRSRAGKEYRIFVSVPAAAAPAGGWPVVYVLDGNAWFAHASQQARLQSGGRPERSGVVPAVVVGVGYPGDALINTARRVPDFTPDAPLREPNPVRWPATGGAEAFMAFLLDELDPEIARRFTVDPDRRILFGHSLGGLFALHAYLRHADRFSAIVAASPSVWWNGRFMLGETQAFVAGRERAGTAPAARLLIAVGGEELPFMVDGAQAVYEQLRRLDGKGSDVALAELASEDHLSAAPVALNRLIRRFLAPTPDDIAHYLAQVPPDAMRPAASNGLIETRGRYVAQDGAREYSVREYVPAGIAPAAVQRTIYVLGDGAALDAALRVANTATLGTAVVALADAQDRTLDAHALTPTPNSTPEERGGAEDLLRFLHVQLVPAIARERGRAAGDSVLVGSGQAGLFALYAASNQPDAFGAYVALDPATEWRNRFILSPNVIGRLAPKLSTRQQYARVLLVAGDDAPESTRLLFEQLQAMDGVGTHLAPAGEDRVQALAATIERAFALRGQVPPARARVFTADTGIPVPTADAYVRLTPQERFDLRMRLRGLQPDRAAEVAAWTELFKYRMDAALWYLEHRLLHEEKERMDALHGYQPPGP